ncbi:inorganic diphosphatase [Candidatus Woesearchaeota archaeon]|nr:inorganic diphosphatase [Candidatus Woesearchaeota archaeon]
MDKQHSWHIIGIGKNFPKHVNAIIEISKNSHVKYEVDKETGLLKLDRFLYSAVHYPGDYGFVPRTLWEDGDPIDIIVLTNIPVQPLTLVSVRIIGVLRMIDVKERDDKIIGVYDCDPRFAEYKDIKDIPKHIILELKHFFETYKELEGKKCKVLEILDRKAAYKDIEKGLKLYAKNFRENK